MNFKIENIILNITNYPAVEAHLEVMASKGWMISKIILGHIFIYKKTRPENLEFSVVPYEKETSLTRKTKDEIEKNIIRNEDLGWRYCEEVSSFHLYFKEKDSDAEDIIASEKEEFEILESLGKTQNKSSYFLLFIFTIGFIAISRFLFTSIDLMKNGLIQILLIITPLLIAFILMDLFTVNKFLKINKENIALEKNIKYSNSKFTATKIFLFLLYLYLLIFILHMFYTTIILKDYSNLAGQIPVIAGLLAGLTFKFFVKPSKESSSSKVLLFVVAIVGAWFVSSIITPSSITDYWKSEDNIYMDGQKVLTIHDFQDKAENVMGHFSQDLSLTVPKSYEYMTMGGNSNFIVTNYSKALTKDLAINLVNRYKHHAEEELEKSILKAEEKLWHVDEAYFLSDDKRTIVLRNHVEVWFLQGMDFSDSEIRKIAMNKLGI